MGKLPKVIQLVKDTRQQQPNLCGGHSLKLHCHSLLEIWGKGCGSPELIFKVIGFFFFFRTIQTAVWLLSPTKANFHLSPLVMISGLNPNHLHSL